MAAGVREVGGEPLAEPPRFADVEQATVPTQQVVHARHRRHVVEARPWHVDDEGPSVGRAALVVEQLVEALDAALAELLEEDTEDLGGDLGIGQRAVAIEARDAELGGHRVERAAAHVGQETSREADGADDRGVERRAGGAQVTRVEVGVVRHEHGASRELDEARQDFGEGRSAGDHGIGDPGEPHDEGLDRPAGVHEAHEALPDAAARDPRRADLDDAVARTAGRLEVDDHEVDLGERALERIARAGAPAPLDGVEAEARVRTEERGQEPVAEIRVAAARDEDEIEQLLGRRPGGPVGQILVEPFAQAQKVKKPRRLAVAPGGLSRVAMARSSCSNSSSSRRCRASNWSSSRRRRSWKSSNALVQRAWKRARDSSTPRTMLRVGTKEPWQCGQ